MTGTALLALLLILQPATGRGAGTAMEDSTGREADSLEAVRDPLPPAFDSSSVVLPAGLTVSAPSEPQYRSPGGALLRSAVLPGWGQFYDDEPVKGLLLGAIELGLLGFLIAEHLEAEDARDDFLQSGDSSDEARYETHRQRRLDLIWYTSAAWLYGMLDAYVDAHLYAFEAENREFGSDAGIGAVVDLRF